MTGREAAEQAANISSYLESKGWERDSERRGATIWHLGDNAWVLVPDLRQYDDADFLIHEAVSSIAKYEARPERDVWQDISEPLRDSQYFRLHPDAPSGSIPLPTGLKVAQSVFDIVKAAAAVTEKGTPLLVAGTRTRKINEFLRTVLLGSATPGSYILTTRFSTGAVGQQTIETAGAVPAYSGRAVAEHLHSAIAAAQQAAQEALHGPDGISAFYAATEDGVSANLCKALSQLGGDERDKQFEIGFSWAHGTPGQQQVSQVEFTSEMPRILAAADRELTRMARAGQATITGMITDLHAERNEQSRVKVSGDLQAPNSAGLLSHRALWVQLNDAEYDHAIEAHRDGNTVRATGQLTTRNRRLELHASSFEVFRH